MYQIRIPLFILILQIYHSQVECILFPQYTVMQVNAAISFPIEIPDRKAYLNVGYQFNYGSPFALSNFYKPPYVQNFLSGRNLNDNHFDNATITSRNKRDIAVGLAEMDVTAGELYNTIIDYMISTGNHETCLEKSVCQMSRHPFHIDDKDENLLADMLHFVLTPSKHQGFTNNEIDQKTIYELAEQFGVNGDNCEEIYWQCEKSILDFVTTLNDDYDDD